MTRAAAAVALPALVGCLAGCGGEATVVTDAPDPAPASLSPANRVPISQPAPASRAMRPERREQTPAPAAPVVVRDASAAPGSEPGVEPLLPQPDPLEPAPEVEPPPPGAPLSAKDAGDFITALCEGPGGTLWVGTEDRGVLRYTPSPARSSPQADDLSSSWSRWTDLGGSGGGLPDPNCYALCADRLGRIWAGRQHSGVSVFNGESWRNYGVLDGPLGERVFDIAADPRPAPNGGDVWIASSRGLARYHLEEDRWSYFTRADGLPSDQVEALAFAPDGTLYAGTQCDGLSIARPADGYATWETTTAPQADRIETDPVGDGLPSDQFNDLLVHSDGTVYAATVRGLARSTDGGASWTYTRGRDYADKVKRRFGGPPPRWQPVNKQAMKRLLPEDYVTTLAEAPDGKLWIGFRQHGLMTFDPATGETEEVRAENSDLTEDFVTGIVPVGGGAWAGTYGGGLVKLETAAAQKGTPTPPDRQFAAAPADPPPHPAPAAPPTAVELEILARSLAVPPTEDSESMGKFAGVHLGQDWTTKGDWHEDYGRNLAILCAMGSPLNDIIGAGVDYKVRGYTGPNGRDGEALRHWIHEWEWDDPRVLFSPLRGVRRQASWDDHAEAYPMSHEGPDVWVRFEVPEGVHKASFYFFNKDGHRGRNRYRDYLLELRPAPLVPDRPEQPAAPYLRRSEGVRTLARARIREFWGGMYQSFAVAGPQTYHLKIGCNDSFNTIVSGVFLDRHSGPVPFGEEILQPGMKNLRARSLPVVVAKSTLSVAPAAGPLGDAVNATQTSVPSPGTAAAAAQGRLLLRRIDRSPETGL